MTQSSKTVVTLSDAIIVAVSKLVDDAQAENYREPSHSEIEFQVNKAGLSTADPKQQGQTVGKAKRVRQILYWALDNDEKKGGIFVSGLVAHIRGCGGFREGSPNFVGTDSIATAISAFSGEGFDLTLDGELQNQLLENLSGTELSEALDAYVRRAKKGGEDAALLTGTGKDLMEATAAHVLTKKYGSYPQQSNFPTLLAQAFVALEMAIPNDGGEQTPNKRLDRAFFEAASTINTLRNKEGTGHGRPWLPTVSKQDAKTAVETMGIIAERMLARLNK